MGQDGCVEVSGMLQNHTLACPGVVHWCAYTPGTVKSISDVGMSTWGVSMEQQLQSSISNYFIR